MDRKRAAANGRITTPEQLMAAVRQARRHVMGGGKIGSSNDNVMLNSLYNFVNYRGMAAGTLLLRPDNVDEYKRIFNSGAPPVRTKIRAITGARIRHELALMPGYDAETGALTKTQHELPAMSALPDDEANSTPATTPAPAPKRTRGSYKAKWASQPAVTVEAALEQLTAEDIIGVIQQRLDVIPQLEARVTELTEDLRVADERATEANHWRQEASRLANELRTAEETVASLRNKVAGIDLDLAHAREDLEITQRALTEQKQRAGLRLFSKRVG